MPKVIDMETYKKKELARDIADLKQCILINNYYLSILKPEDKRYAAQKLLLADNELQLKELECLS
jgi:hypothetical protein